MATCLYTQDSSVGNSGTNKVGIGTSSPAETLHVNGGHIKIETTGDTKLIMKNGDNMEATIQYDKDTNGMEFRVGDANCDLFIANGGQVKVSAYVTFVPCAAAAVSVNSLFVDGSSGKLCFKDGSSILHVIC